MTIKGVLTSTHVDRQGDRMAKSALEGMELRLKGHRKLPLTVEHDVALPPLGQFVDGWIEPTEDDEYRLVGIAEELDCRQEVRLPDGTLAIKEWSSSGQHPFAAIETEAPEMVTFSYDMANFASESDLRAFLEEVRVGSEIPTESAVFGRKSLVPDPQIIIALSQTICTYLFTRKIGEPLMTEVGNDIAKLYTILRSASLGLAQYAQPKNRPQTFVLEVPGNPHVQFVVRSHSAETIVSCAEPEKLRAAVQRAILLRAELGAEKVQFLYSVKDGWGLNYFLTEQGEVVGTPASFARRARKLYLSDLGLDMLLDEGMADETPSPGHAVHTHVSHGARVQKRPRQKKRHRHNG